LTTLLTVYSSTILASHVSDRRRSWASPFGAFPSRRVPRHSCRADPHAVSRAYLPDPKGTTDAHNTGYWALLPPRVPCSRSGRLGPVATGGSLGLVPSRGCCRTACDGSDRRSSFVLVGPTDGGHSSRLHLGVSITARLARSGEPDPDPF